MAEPLYRSTDLMSPFSARDVTLIGNCRPEAERGTPHATK